MSQQNPTIIVGHLDDSELTKSIDKLVAEVAKKTSGMAEDFTQAIDKMKFAMKDFAITQKVSVDLMKEAWRDMSKSFDAMVAAQSAATGGGKGSGKGKVYAPDTVGALEQEIAREKEKRREMQLGSDVLRDQNRLLEQRQRTLKQETTSLETNVAKAFQTRIGNVISLPSKSFADANEKLRRLRELLDDMQKRAFLFDESKINRVKNAIDSVETKIERMRKKWGQQGQQPNTLQQVLGMDENSFDAISKKMAALKKLSWSDPIEQKRIIDEYQRLRQEQTKLMASNAQMTRSNNYLAQSFGYIRNRIVYALTLGAITSFIKQIYEIRGQYELLERSLGVLVNSFERGSQIFNELNQMAIESPFTLMELAGAAKQLTAYNFAANEVVDTTRRLADISAALGVPMERLTYNLGQIRAQTVLNARDARDFANAGLPIVKSLSDYYTELEGKIVSTGDVYDRMSKKMVSYNDVMAVLNKMTDEGGKFFEFQAKQAQTLRVQMANLTLAWNNMLNEMGKGNQGLLSLPIQGLKVMLQNWASLNRVLKNVVLSFGLLKVAQMAAIRYNWQLAASAGGAARMMGFLGNAIKSVIASTVALAKNPWTWIFVGIMAITDLIGKWRAARQEIAELNDELKENAYEAGKSNFDFLSNKGNVETRKLAKENKLTAEQGEKAWQAIEQQISTSAMSANKLLGELWAINDVNERVAKGFDYAEKIQKAQAALANFGDDIIDITQDKGWWGMFGEGLVSDLKDFKNELDGFKGTSEELNKILNTDYGTNNTIKIAFKELQGEIKETAESINNFIVANNIKDPIQINEILSRAKAIIKTRNPEIKGELATLFDMQLDEQMSKFNSNIDKSSSLWEMFMERLKHNSSATFQDITSDIYKENSKLSKEQQNAVDENLEYFKKTMPFYYNAVKDMVSDASRLKIQIGIAFNVKALTDFQQEVNDRIAKASKVLDFGTEAMLPTQNDNLQTWVKTQQDAIKGLREQNKLYKKDSSEWSKEQIKNNDKEIQQRKNLLDLFNQSYEKERKNGGKKRDPMLDTIKQTTDIVKKLQSEYDTLTKSGASSADALDDVRKRYSRTITILNRNLQDFGLPQLNLEIIKGRNPNDVLEYFQKISDILTNKGLSTLERQKAVEVVIQEFSLKAKTYNLDMITKGLNNKLGKLKDEYELAVELDANPELGNMFTEMFGIDTSTFPQNIDEYMQRVQQEFDKMREKRGFGEPLNIFKADDAKWESWGRNMGLVVDVLDENGNVIDKNTDALDKLTPKFKEAQGVAKKWAQDTLKSTQDLQYKLADNNGKIAIEEEKLAVLRQQLAQETNDKQKALLELQIQDQQNAINKLKEEILQLLPTYQRVFGEVAEHSAYMTRKLAKDYKNMLVEGKNRGLNADNTYSVRDPITGQIARISKDRMGKELKNADKELQKTDNVFKKIKESLTKGEDKIVDWVGGIENIGEALGQVGDLVDTIGNVYDMFGNPNEYDETSEAIHDVATSLQGVNTAAKGIGQIASGDYIGGAMSVVSGLSSAIGTWFDNGDKEILQQIKDSELAVKRLELAYIDLDHAVKEAYGMATIGAQKAAIANKELQLVELKRQLALEQSRDSKHRDEDRIVELQKQIKELQYDIKDATDAIVNDLLGISSVGDALENVMGNIIDAFRSGSYKLKDIMKDVKVSFNDMIANMVMKMYTTRVLQPWFEEQWNKIQDQINERAGEVPNKLAEQRAKVSNAKMADVNNSDSLVGALRDLGFSDKEIHRLNWFNEFGEYDFGVGRNARLRAAYEKALKEAEQKEAKLQKDLTTATTISTDDIRQYAELLRSGQPIVTDQLKEIESFLRELGLLNDKKETTLSALQAGISGITEDTAGALEAYMNGVSQQVYLHSDLLTQIRDAVVSFDMDVQLGVFSQMLLQLQQSYTVQMAIQGILEGVLNPSGRAFSVELVS